MTSVLHIAPHLLSIDEVWISPGPSDKPSYGTAQPWLVLGGLILLGWLAARFIRGSH